MRKPVRAVGIDIGTGNQQLGRKQFAFLNNYKLGGLMLCRHSSPMLHRLQNMFAFDIGRDAMPPKVRLGLHFAKLLEVAAALWLIS